MDILVRDIRLPFDRDARYAEEKARRYVSRLGSAVKSTRIYRRSLDARKKNALSYVYTVCVGVSEEFSREELARQGLSALTERVPEVHPGLERQTGRPVVVGFGPCGMFCALMLAENGYAPIVIERGGDTDDRLICVRRFESEGILDPECNIQFGAGGAGTFSDGKLMTRINDEYCRYILERMRDFGAPDVILTEARPHIGTDYLPHIVKSIGKRIEELGGSVFYRTALTGIVRSPDGAVREVITSRGSIECSCAVLALGHSARDTCAYLRGAGLVTECKPFSVGVRIEHLQDDIDKALYGENAGNPALPKGEYSLSARFDGRGVYSFCMCPGGTVAAAASEEGGVVTNGMSDFARAGKNANAALAVSVFPSDFGGNVDGAVRFVREIERSAFRAGGGDYSAPVQTVGDFLTGKSGTAPSRVLPTYAGGRVRPSDLTEVLPPFVTKTLRSGIEIFEKHISGFSSPDSLLTGAETRTSSPLRMPRGTDGLAEGFTNVYPCGEGAGYAGGITSAAVDGVRCAVRIIGRYSR